MYISAVLHGSAPVSLQIIHLNLTQTTVRVSFRGRAGGTRPLDLFSPPFETPFSPSYL